MDSVTKSYFVFFIIVLLLFIILICFYLIPIVNYFKNINKKSQLILKDPIFLNAETTYLISPSLGNYTFTFWIYINNITTNYEIPIFNYSDYLPAITLKNNLLNNINFYPYHNKSIQFNIKTQKWNFIVIQYIEPIVEFYLNADLIFSFDLKYIDMKNNNNILTIGNDNKRSNGIGAISNINYYPNNLTAKEIKFQYELNMSQNNPF
jgi:hypothetical protein